MLLQFIFKNYRSFKEEVILDLTATKISEYNERVVEIGNERLLTTTAIFGANASGKSNVQEAFRYMHNYVIDSFEFGGEAKERKSKFMKPTPFLFDENSRNEESTFEVYFIGDESVKYKTYNYGFSIDSKGVKEEWLNTKAKTSRGNFKPIFYRNRDNEEMDLSGIPSKYHENLLISLHDESLLVSLGSKLKVNILTYIRDWFMNNEIANFGDPLENFVMSNYMPKGFADDENIRNDVLRYFSTFDNSIVDFKVEELKDDADEVHYKITSYHKGKDNKLHGIPLREESAGTLKMLAMYDYIKDTLNRGGVFFVDELNARLHPLLVRNLLITFLNKEINKKNAQIIFTSHDPWTLSNDLLRRDEIWFVEKDKDGCSSLFSLADFEDEDGSKIRKDENYMKNYLLGKYGAIPELKEIKVMEE